LPWSDWRGEGRGLVRASQSVAERRLLDVTGVAECGGGAGGGGRYGGGRYGGVRHSAIDPDRDDWLWADDVFLLPKPLELERDSGDASSKSRSESSGALRACLACLGGRRLLPRLGVG